MNYWDKQKRLKEVYDRATNDSGVSWHEEYLKEKAKRFEVEEKYERLTRKIKENAVKEVNAREVEAEFGKLVQERLDDDEEPIKVDFGAGPREVQHIMKRRDYEKDI